MNPVPTAITDDNKQFWTDDLEECIKWFFAGTDKKIPEAVKVARAKKEPVKLGARLKLLKKLKKLK